MTDAESMDRPETRNKWVEMMGTSVGDEARLVILRTKKAAPRSERYDAGFGFFCLLKSTTKDFKVRIPMKLLPYLRQKIAEYEADTHYVTPFITEDVNFTVIKFHGKVTKDVQLQIFKRNPVDHCMVNMNLDDLRHFANVLEVMAVLITSQPEREKREGDYLKFYTSVFNWLSAFVAHKDVKANNGGSASGDPQQFRNQWSNVVENYFVGYHNNLEEATKKVKMVIPIDRPYVSAYNDEFALRGFEYEKPVVDWEPIQLLVSLIVNARIFTPEFSK